MFGERAFQLFGRKLEITQAPETTDIIFENFEVTQEQKNAKKLVVFSILVGVLVTIFLLFAYLQARAGKTQRLYP